MESVVYIKKYRLPASITRDMVLKDCVPIGHAIVQILILNKSSNNVTISLNVNGETTIPIIDIEANGYATISPSAKYFKNANAYIIISSTNWNGAKLAMDVLYWRVV